MTDSLPMATMQRPRKAKFGFKTYITETTLFPVTSWLRDNLPPASPDTWWFTLRGDTQMNIYTNEPLIAAHLVRLTET